MESIKNTIKTAIELMKSFKRRTSADYDRIWLTAGGYDADNDLCTKKFFKTVKAIKNYALRECLYDLWSANYNLLASIPDNQETPQLNYAAVETALCEMAEFGSPNYHQALQALMAKYNQ